MIANDPAVGESENPVVLFMTDIPEDGVGVVTRSGSVGRRGYGPLPIEGRLIVDEQALDAASPLTVSARPEGPLSDEEERRMYALRDKGRWRPGAPVDEALLRGSERRELNEFERRYRETNGLPSLEELGGPEPSGVDFSL